LNDLPFYLCLAGPTASGKSAAALAIAQELNCEIVSVDSALVYRGMDIGTAKPTRAERDQVAHHLIDIRDPLQPYSAADFVRDARAHILAIHARGKRALLVGGTMLYFKALFDGLDAMPSANPELRAQLEQEAQHKGWPAMHAELAQVDPVTAARLAPLDKQRIQRALEVYRISGVPLSQWHAAKDVKDVKDVKDTSKSIAASAHPISPASSKGDKFIISLEPERRDWLHARIAERFDAMLAAGFLDEVRTLRARGDLHPDLPAMRCVGYRQAWEALDVADVPDMPTLRERGIAATRQLAKRQLTWLRSMPQRLVVACDQPGALEKVIQASSSFWD
jgi:tRNA dimethylallyltransferase